MYIWYGLHSFGVQKLDDFAVDVDPNMKVEEFQAKVAEAMGWEVREYTYGRLQT